MQLTERHIIKSTEHRFKVKVKGEGLEASDVYK